MRQSLPSHTLLVLLLGSRRKSQLGATNVALLTLAFLTLAHFFSFLMFWLRAFLQHRLLGRI